MIDSTREVLPHTTMQVLPLGPEDVLVVPKPSWLRSDDTDHFLHELQRFFPAGTRISLVEGEGLSLAVCHQGSGWWGIWLESTQMWVHHEGLVFAVPCRAVAEAQLKGIPFSDAEVREF